MTIPFKFELGEVLKDKVTGFIGVCMSRTQYYTDCNHYGLLSQNLDKDKQPMKDWHYLDETRLLSMKKKVDLSPRVPTSGMFPNPPKR
jgi:heat shock protein HspQ